jgi:hypothetical protein
MAMYQSMKVEITLKIKQANHISLTTDLWNLSNKTGYMVITAHYLTAE